LLLESKDSRRERREKRAEAKAEPSRQETRRESASARAGIAPFRRAAESAEKRVIELNSKLKDIDKKLAVPELFERDRALATRLSKDRANLVRALAEAEEAWLGAQAAWEGARMALADE
jgi:ATP-binding cassette, subfamily F, member 3